MLEGFKEHRDLNAINKNIKVGQKVTKLRQNKNQKATRISAEDHHTRQGSAQHITRHAVTLASKTTSRSYTEAGLQTVRCKQEAEEYITYRKTKTLKWNGQTYVRKRAKYDSVVIKLVLLP